MNVEAEDDSDSIVQVELPPWAEDVKILSEEGQGSLRTFYMPNSGLIKSTDDNKWIDSVVEDKHRRIRHSLEQGDVIEAVHNVRRVVGIDSSGMICECNC